MTNHFAQKYRDLSITIRLFLIIFMVLFVVLVVAFWNFYVYTAEKKSSTATVVTLANSQAINEIDAYIEDVMNITKIPLTFKQTDTTYIRSLEEFNDTNVATLDFQKMNEQMFEEIMTYKKNIDSCFVFNLNGNSDYKVKTPILKPLNPSDQDWFGESVEAFGYPVIIDTYQLPNTADNRAPVNLFGISRGIVQIQTGKVIGVLLVNTKVDYFEEICANMLITDNQRIVIKHGNHTIYDTTKEKINKPLDDEIQRITWSESKFETVEVEGTEMFASTVVSDHNKWQIINLIPTDELYKDLNYMQRINMILAVVVLIIIATLLLSIASRIVKPIKQLALSMKSVEDGHFETQIDIPYNDEIGMLSNSFNSMTKKINNLIHEVYLDKILQGELELQMLQTQINPHFLYNTLESISMMATINDDDTTSEMVSDLGSILRYGISNKNPIVTLGEEIEHLKKYVSLQNVRFESIFKVVIDIDEALYSLPMVKLIIQPLLENAIYHGMSNTRQDGLITISATLGDVLIISVLDNGKGMSEELTSNLNGYINNLNNNFNSIGLKNVNRRIKIHYGESFGLLVKSSVKGTEVVATIGITPTTHG